MILHKLSLNNFGLFRESHSIQLTPNGTGPVILIGGMNGAGKTTLLDAVRLCLYGKRFLGARVSHNEYSEYLSAMIHRNPTSPLPLDHASISLEFEYARGGEKKQYRVERAWQKRGKTYRSVQEDFFVSEDNQLNADFDAAYWQDYINELIPIGVSQFFFFDGENIQKITEDSNHEQFLAESIKSLLGLNLVDRLQSDLRIYANRLAKDNSPEPLQKEIENVQLEIADLSSSLNDATEHLESIQTKIERLETQISGQESRIAAEGGSYTEKRENLKLQQEQLPTEIETLENQIRDLCGNLFPFALVPDLLMQLEERLHKEIEYDQWEEKNRVLKTQNTDLINTLESASFWNDSSLSEFQISSESLINFVRLKITPKLKTQLELPEGLHGFKKVRERSSSEYDQLFEWIDTCLNDIPQEFRELNDALKNAELELQKVEQDLQRVPDEEVLKPLIEKLSKLNQKLGQLHEKEKDENLKIRSLNYQLRKAKRKLEKLRHTQQLGEAHIKRQQKVSQVQSVLSSYTSRLTQSKIVTLGNSIVESFNQLSHKPDRISRVEINADTFAVTLFDSKERELSKEELSAGEKQIYTTALLWGLAKTSGKPLPMILDTPLGRLDSSHRKLLVERYFPHASHQVILLSTDTEIDEHLHSLLEPFISHTFHLAYRKSDGHTTITEGYF